MWHIYLADNYLQRRAWQKFIYKKIKNNTRCKVMS